MSRRAGAFRLRRTRVLGSLNGLFLILGFILGAGCQSSKHRVITVTGTVIGLELAENPATQVPHAKLGYNRAELAYIPTNRPSGDDPTGEVEGAEESVDVLMELKYAGIFSWGASGGIYQRLAVGKEAVRQPGAAYMFARDVKGNLEPLAAEQVTAALRNIEIVNKISERRTAIVDAYEYFRNQPAKKALFDSAVAPFADFRAFLLADEAKKNALLPLIETKLREDAEIRKFLDDRLKSK